MDLIAIIRSIKSNPGNIPEEKEWDMVSDSNTEGLVSEEDQIRKSKSSPAEKKKQIV